MKSSSGGKGKGKLTIEGLAKKATRSSTSTPKIESSTQEKIGSSTQNPKKESAQKPASSKTVTEKHSKSDYAFPIETLMALQQQGCETLKIPKKSWAEMCSEDETDEISLSQTIENMKNKQLVVHDPKQKNKQVVSQPAPISVAGPEKSQPLPFFPKDKFLDLVQIEPEFYHQNVNKVHQKIFPNGFHFEPKALNKTQKFYEFILVDSDSIAIKHHFGSQKYL